MGESEDDGMVTVYPRLPAGGALIFKTVNASHVCFGCGEMVELYDEHTKMCRECWRERFRPRLTP